MRVLFWGEVKNGTLTLHNLTRFKNYLKSIEGEVEVAIGKPKRLRTLQQNKYYWGVVLEVLYKQSEVGYTREEWHNALKFKFLRKEGLLPTVESTTKLTTLEFEDYLDRIRQWAIEFLDCTIPLPNEVEY